MFRALVRVHVSVSCFFCNFLISAIPSPKHFHRLISWNYEKTRGLFPKCHPMKMFRAKGCDIFIRVAMRIKWQIARKTLKRFASWRLSREAVEGKDESGRFHVEWKIYAFFLPAYLGFFIFIFSTVAWQTQSRIVRFSVANVRRLSHVNLIWTSTWG